MIARRPRWVADPRRRTIWQLYWWAFSIRSLIGLIAYGLTLYTDIAFFEDALYYEHVGYSIASDWLSGRSVDLNALSQGGVRTGWLMIVGIAVFYFVMQGVRALPLLLVLYSAVTAWVPVFVYRISCELGMSQTAARRAGWLVVFSPAFVFWSGSLYKEGIIMLALSGGIYHALRLQSRWRPQSLVLLALSLFGLLALRFYLAILVSAVAAVGLLWGRAQTRQRVHRSGLVPAAVRQSLIAVAFVAFMITLGFSEGAERRLTESPEGQVVELDLTRLNVDRQWSATSAYSGYLTEADISTPSAAVEYLPVGLVYFLAVPFPWQFGSLRQNLVIPETAFWLLLYPLIGIGLVRGMRVNRAGTVVLVAVTAGMCLIYALVSGNVGIAYRMRSQVWLLWAPFAAWGWDAWSEWCRGPRDELRAQRDRAAVRAGRPSGPRRLAR